MIVGWKLDGHKTVPCTDIKEWAEWFEKSERHVGSTKFKNGVFVSTVFLGIDHSFGSGPPVLFETMIFGGQYDGYQERYSTWNEAEEGHQRAIDFCFIEGKERSFFPNLG